MALLAEIRDAQTELGTRVDARAGKIAATSVCAPSPAPDAAAFAKGLGKNVLCGEQRAIHRRLHKPCKKRVRMPSMLDPHIEDIERWLAAEPHLTALVILGRLAERCPGQFGAPQHTIVQRLLKALRRKAAGQLIAAAEPVGQTTSTATVHGTIEASSTSPVTPLAAQIAARRRGMEPLSVTLLDEAIRGSILRAD